MVKDDNGNGTLGCKTATGQELILNSGQAKLKPTEKSFNFCPTLFFVFKLASAHLAHFVLPRPHKPTPKAKQKEPNFAYAQIAMITI
jgi:hypothetical protein